VIAAVSQASRERKFSLIQNYLVGPEQFSDTDLRSRLPTIVTQRQQRFVM
jgi:hypothetical protein